MCNLFNGSLIPRPRALNIPQRLLQTTQLYLHFLFGLLRIADSNLLELVNGAQLFLHVVSGWLEVSDVALDLIHNGLVFEDRSVVREIDGLGLLGQRLHFAAGVVVAFLEG